MYTFMGAVVIAVLLSIIFTFSYGKLIVAAERSILLGRENRKLKHQVAQIDSLQLELIHLRALSIQIKGMLGMQLSYEDSVLVANLSPTANSPAIAAEEVNETMGTSEQRNMLEALPSLWPVKGYVTREFNVTSGEANPRYHPGIDIAVEVETPIAAAADGVVELAGFDDTYGWMVRIDHGYGIHTLYGHNSRNLVRKGDRITRGQTVALVGSTGKSTAPHLHFGVRKNGVPVDPRDFLLH